MPLLVKLLICLIAIMHLFFLWFEMFAWERRGPKVFTSISKELFPQTKVLAANQGLYNGFLAAGLIWSLFISDSTWSIHVATFFLICIFIAGCYGAYSADKKIFSVQALPALIALILLKVLPFI